MKNFEKWSKIIFPLIVFILGAFILNKAFNIEFIRVFFKTLIPFIFAFLFAWILNPVVVFFTNKFKMQRWIASIIVVILITVFLIVNLIIIIPVLFKQFNVLFEKVPVIVKSLQNIINDVSAYLGIEHNFKGLTNILDRFSTGISKVTSELFNQSLNILKSTGKFISRVATSIFIITMSLVAAIYILIDFDKLKSSFYSVIPKRYKNDVIFLSSETNRVLIGYIRGLIIESFFVFIISFILLTIFRVDGALAFAFIIGVTNIIPYVGPFIGAIPVALFSLTVSFKLFLISIVIVLVVQQIDGLILKPKIFGRTTNLHPAISIFSIILFGKVFGFIGIVLAIPVTAMGIVVIKFIYGKLKMKYPEVFE